MGYGASESGNSGLILDLGVYISPFHYPKTKIRAKDGRPTSGASTLNTRADLSLESPLVALDGLIAGDCQTPQY